MAEISSVVRLCNTSY
uniref:Uncharacterized protein n=1 Tax=Arundo donax TaxID=35708 RepID=A0A0A9EQ51_ARUDO